MMVFITIFIWTTLLFAPSEGAIEADKIDDLPGFLGDLPEPQYSGYLDISGGKHLHYWLVLSASENGTNDPLVLWFNGGPGCSSLAGFFYEQGPFRVDNSVSPPTLSSNPHRWNLVANVVYIEAPAGVGLSYADTEEGNYNDDKQQAIDNFEALLKFYEGFPEFRTNRLIITGESYAGMYVPTLALQVLAYNEKHRDDSINLDGIMVGNGVVGQNTGLNGQKFSVEYLHGHGLFANAVYDDIVKECGDYSDRSERCKTLLSLMHEQVGRVNIYDIYGPCTSTDSKSDVWVVPPSELQLNGSSGGLGPVACLDGAKGADYLNQDNVRKAIHCKSVEEIGNWRLCGGKLRYTKNWGSLLPFYKDDIIPKIRVCIFNGEADACVPFNENEEWTSTLGIPVVQTWRSWDVEGQVAGFVTEYKHDFTFVTVKGAGHMVPETHPIQGLAMFDRFINNLPF